MEVEDFIRAMRFIIRACDGNSAYLAGFEKLLTFHDTALRLVKSYHVAVADEVAARRANNDG